MVLWEEFPHGNDTVTIGGRPRHVVGYLQDFLFTAERARSPARILSGGERNRLLLARLFAKPKARRPVAEKPRRLTFKEARELEALPDRIAGLEAEQEKLHQTLADPAYYRTAGEAVAQLTAKLAELEQELAEGYRRWEELEAVRG